MATLTASALSKSYSNPGIHISDNFAAVLQTGLDDVFKRTMARPSEGMAYVRNRKMNKLTDKFQSHFGLGVVSQNSDTERLVYDEKGLGFGWELTSNIFRGAIAISRELKEDELYGTITDLQADLSESYKTTEELVIADAFNRCLGTAGAPFLCEDGMYLIDSDRPNAYKVAGTWSNLESASAITATSIYTATLNFAANKDERGYLAPLTLKKIVIRPTDEKALWEILKSDLRPTDAMNAANFMKGRFEYSVYNYLTSAVVLYLAGDPKGKDNELIFGERMSPSIKTWEDGTNPDIIRQRIRGRFGLGCGRPTMWRGGTVS